MGTNGPVARRLNLKGILFAGNIFAGPDSFDRPDRCIKMKPLHRTLLIALALMALATIAGLVITSDWGSRRVPLGNHRQQQAQSPVDTHQMQTALALAPLAASAEEQDLARSALRAADHEVDFAFASALYQAEFQQVPSTPEIRAIQERVTKAEADGAEIDADVARINKKLTAAANQNQKQTLAQQLDLAKARQELNQDEIADAHADLERAGGDPKSRIQRMVDEHNSAEQDTNGKLDVSVVGKQSSATQPASSSFLSRARALYALHAFVKQLGQAQIEASVDGSTFSTRHDELERQLEQAKSEQSQKPVTSLPGQRPTPNSPGGPGTPDQTNAAIASYRSLAAMQKRMSSLDSRIRNEQDLANSYDQWAALAAARERGLSHSLLISFAWMLLIGFVVLIADYFLERTFDRLEPDQRKLLTMRAVAHMVTRAAGVILILLLIFGAPSQMATILALAGAGLTVALKDFIVGFFGWFVLMGKNGIRHGDWVEINGVSGEVVEIGLFHTVLLETGNWNDSGHPTGRRVTFVNSYAIEGHYFNFSTSGQWLWDEIQVALPVDQDPYPIVDEIQKIVKKETEANANLAEQEWERLGNTRGIRDFSAGPAISVRPANPGFEILVRYVTRANERHSQRSKLYYEVVELLRRKNIPQSVPPASIASPTSQ